MKAITQQTTTVPAPVVLPSAENPIVKVTALSVAVTEDYYLNPHTVEGFLGVDEYILAYIFCNDGTITQLRRLSGGRTARTKVPKLPTQSVGTVQQVRTKNPRSEMLVESSNILPHGKIPCALLYQVVAFFKDVMTSKLEGIATTHTTATQQSFSHAYEAMAFIVYSTATKQYEVRIPTQRVSGAAVDYDRNSYDEQAGDIMVVDVHSHNIMGAFFSGTDDRDDAASFCYSGVVGNLDKPSPNTVWRLNLGDKKVKMDASDIFDFTVKLPETPQAWLDKVTVRSARTWPLYGGYNGYGGFNFGDEDGGTTPPRRSGKRFSRGRNSQGKTMSAAGFLNKSLWTAITNANIDPELLKLLGDDAEEYGLEPYKEEVAGIEPLLDSGEVAFIPVENMAQLQQWVVALVGLQNVVCAQYPLLNTVGIYEIVCEHIAPDWEATVGDGGEKMFTKTQGDGISIKSKDFPSQYSLLQAYIDHMLIDDVEPFTAQVWELVHDLCTGLVW